MDAYVRNIAYVDRSTSQPAACASVPPPRLHGEAPMAPALTRSGCRSSADGELADTCKLWPPCVNDMPHGLAHLNTWGPAEHAIGLRLMACGLESWPLG